MSHIKRKNKPRLLSIEKERLRPRPLYGLSESVPPIVFLERDDVKN